MYDFHTHTFLSDGVLAPVELIRRAHVRGYRVMAITDHVGHGNLEFVLNTLIKDCEVASRRWDILALPGVEITHTPKEDIDALAAEGTLFTHAYAESLPTMPTRHTWWTGRTQFPFRGWQPFENTDFLLAEILWDKGYTSALVTDVYHMHKPVYNCGRGFDTVSWVRGQEYDPWIVDDAPVDIERWHRLRGDDTDALWRPRFEQYMRNRSTFEQEEDWFAPRVTQEAIRWLDHQTKEVGKRDDLFLWVDYFDPHEPWDPP